VWSISIRLGKKGERVYFDWVDSALAWLNLSIKANTLGQQKVPLCSAFAAGDLWR
jgi:hypothetical protein